MSDTEPMRVLNECIELMRKKAHDYQNPNSEVRQADYYPNGLLTIMDIIWAKYLRAKSLIEAHQSGNSPKNESLEDTFKDMANYASFAVAFIRGKIDGQQPDRDILNKKIVRTGFMAPANPIQAVNAGPYIYPEPIEPFNNPDHRQWINT